MTRAPRNPGTGYLARILVPLPRTRVHIQMVRGSQPDHQMFTIRWLDRIAVSITITISITDAIGILLSKMQELCTRVLTPGCPAHCILFVHMVCHIPGYRKIQFFSAFCYCRYE